MGRGRWVGIGVAAVVVLGLGVLVVSLTGAKACTKVGCSSAVSIDLESLPPEVRAAAVSTTICANDTCSTNPVGSGRQMTGVVIDGSTVRTATLVVTDGAGVEIARLALAGAIEAHLVQPNGPDCEPTCWQLDLVAADGALVPEA